jgi:hypothetical protein
MMTPPSKLGPISSSRESNRANLPTVSSNRTRNLQQTSDAAKQETARYLKEKCVYRSSAKAFGFSLLSVPSW